MTCGESERENLGSSVSMCVCLLVFVPESKRWRQRKPEVDMSV